jgi:hypothetical protein
MFFIENELPAFLSGRISDTTRREGPFSVWILLYYSLTLQKYSIFLHDVFCAIEILRKGERIVLKDLNHCVIVKADLHWRALLLCYSCVFELVLQNQSYPNIIFSCRLVKPNPSFELYLSNFRFCFWLCDCIRSVLQNHSLYWF